MATSPLDPHQLAPERILRREGLPAHKARSLDRVVSAGDLRNERIGVGIMTHPSSPRETYVADVDLAL